jgi:hypothetical protein
MKTPVTRIDISGNGSWNASPTGAWVSSRNYDALEAKVNKLAGALCVIAGMGLEENEWDAVDRFRKCREMANEALQPIKDPS